MVGYGGTIHRLVRNRTETVNREFPRRLSKTGLFRSVQDYVLADGDHPIRVSGTESEPRPYVAVRDGLEALIARAPFYRLVELCQEEADGYWLWSAGVRFRLG